MSLCINPSLAIKPQTTSDASETSLTPVPLFECDVGVTLSKHLQQCLLTHLRFVLPEEGVLLHSDWPKKPGLHSW